MTLLGWKDRLQPQKSVSIQIKPKSTKMASAPVEYTLGKDQMPNVERAVHLGIIKTTCALDNIKENVDENMKKARRSAYALFGCGFHGENGLLRNNDSSLQNLYNTSSTVWHGSTKGTTI